jgi:DNA invertase Pin-like site-specific DNA recombinase
MNARPYVAYYRVSTRRQEHSGLSLEAQRAAVVRFMETTPGRLVAEFSETASGSKDNRRRLDDALRECRIRRAILIVATLDRLSRTVVLTSSLMESGVPFVVADFPEANSLTLHLLAAAAEYEARLISERIKASLSAAKARGVKLGGPPEIARINIRAAIPASAAARATRSRLWANDLAPTLWPLRAKGKSYQSLAEELMRLGVDPPKKGKWGTTSIRKILRLTACEYAGAAEAAAKLRPRSVGARERAAEIAPIVWPMRAEGKSCAAIAKQLNRQNVVTLKRRKWHASTVWQVLARTSDIYRPTRCITTSGDIQPACNNRMRTSCLTIAQTS